MRVDLVLVAPIDEENDRAAPRTAAARLFVGMSHEQRARLQLLDEPIALHLRRLTDRWKADKVTCMAHLAVRATSLASRSVLMLSQAGEMHIPKKPLAVAWYD